MPRNSLPGNPNLPPGTTDRMINEAYDEYRYCGECGVVLHSTSEIRKGICKYCSADQQEIDQMEVES